MFLELFNIVMPVFVCAGLGFWWTKSGRKYDAELITDLISVIGMPCIIFSVLTSTDLTVEAFGEMALGTAICLASFMALGYGLLKATKQNIKAFLPTLMFPNIGNMGLPLNMLAFGEPGLALAVAYFTVTAVVQFTVGIGINAGTLSLKELARIPTLYAVALALVFMIGDFPVPAVVASTTDLIGGMVIPIMLITLGISLASLRISGITRGILLSIVRLVMGFLVGALVADLLGFTGVTKGVLIVESAMPVAVFNYLFAMKYKNEPEAVAGMVVISTILSFATLPFLMWYVL